MRPNLPMTDSRDDAQLRQAAMRLLQVRPRSRSELVNRLVRRGFAADDVERLADRLEQDGWLNDPQFARLWANWRLDGMPMGRARLEAELGARGVGREIIGACLDQIFSSLSELELAREAVRKRSRRLRELSDDERRRKLWSFLQRRGFPASVSRRVVEETVPGSDSC